MTTGLRTLAAIAALGLAAVSAAADPPADIVLRHGKIHTQDPTRRVVQALALRGNSIVAVGTDQEVSVLIGPRTRTVDLGGQVVLPGIIDAHTHPAESAQDLDKCSLGDKTLAPADIKTRVSGCLKDNPGDPKLWFEVVQVNASGLTLTLNDLDSMLANRPMVLSGADGRTRGQLGGIERVSHQRDHHEPSGAGSSVIPTAIRLARCATTRPSLCSPPSHPAGLDFEALQLEKAFAGMRATGITSVQDAAVDEHLMQIYKRLYDTHRLKMRVRGSLHLKNLHESAEILINRAIKFRTKWAIDPDYLRADAVKIFADGVIEAPSQTAALLGPYLDADGHPTRNRGPSYFTQDNLNRIVAADAQARTDRPRSCDRRPRGALGARCFAYSRRREGARDNRDQIAHLELVNPADFSRFKELGVIANFQLLWAERDDYMVKGTLSYLGPERSRYLCPGALLRDAGALIAGGSDWNIRRELTHSRPWSMPSPARRAAAGHRCCPSKASLSRTSSTAIR